MSDDPGRLAIVVTSPRVAPGLLDGRAWSLLTSAGLVLASGDPNPHVPALQDAGLVIGLLTDAGTHDQNDPAQWLLSLAGTHAPQTVAWLQSPDGDPGLIDALAAAAAAIATTGAPVPSIDVVVGSFDVPGARLLDLVAVMDRLRSPGGCPWDAKQTHTSLTTYLVEEAYEVVEALETDSADRDGLLLEELGDLLLQVVFHSRIAQEHVQPWSIDDVAEGIVDKLVRRHPHVFGDSAGETTADHVESLWEARKAVEKGRESVTDGIPVGLPALATTAKLWGRARRAGLEVEPPALDVSIEHSAPGADPDAALGDALLAVAVRLTDRGHDPEQVLRQANRALAEHIRTVETTTS